MPYESRTEVVAVFDPEVPARTVRSIASSIVRGRFAIFGASVTQPECGSITVTVRRDHSSDFLAALAESGAKEAVSLHIADAGVGLDHVTLTTTRLDAPVSAAGVTS